MMKSFCTIVGPLPINRWATESSKGDGRTWCEFQPFAGFFGLVVDFLRIPGST